LRARYIITEKTGKILRSIKISAHPRAPNMLDVDANESNRIITRPTKKGFRILEVKLAIRFLITLNYLLYTWKGLLGKGLCQLTALYYWSQPFPIPRLLPLTFSKGFLIIGYLPIVIGRQVMKVDPDISTT